MVKEAYICDSAAGPGLGVPVPPMVLAAGILIFLGFSFFIFSAIRNARFRPIAAPLFRRPMGTWWRSWMKMLDSKMGHRISIFFRSGTCTCSGRPSAGRIADVVYRPGRFYAALRAAASRENEQNIIYIQTPRGTLVFKQIAGAIARRVICWKREGQMVALGERVGMIRFGSRVDVWLPMEAQVVVQRGQKVKGGESILAKWNSTT